MMHPMPLSRSRPRSTPLLPLLFALAAGGAGCGAADTPAPGEDLLLEPQVETLYRVGTMEGGTWDSFTRISGAAFSEDGTLHLLDPQQRRVHRVGPDGSHLGSFGISGEGPGEFRSPAGIQVLADGRVVVADQGHQAFLVFSPSGEYLHAYGYQATSAMPGNRLFRQGASGIVGQAQSFRFQAGPGGGAPALPTTVPVRRWELPEGEGEAEVTTLAEAWRPERETPRPSTSGGGMAMVFATQRALEPQVHVTVFPDGSLAVADSSAYRIRVYGPEGEGGEEPRIFERPLRPLPVTPAMEAAERERRLAELESGGGPQISIQTAGGGGAVQQIPQAQIQEMLQGQVAQLTFWPEIPLLNRIEADREGRLWVERSGPEIGAPGPTDLLTSHGEYLGTIPADGVRIPLAFGPGGLAAWVELDELEVSYVRVGRITLP